MHRYLIACALYLSASCWACVAMKPEVNRSHASLVKEAKSIVILQAVGVPGKKSKCDLRVVKVIKGKAPSKLGVSCRMPDPDDWMTSFENHTNVEFWSNAGRLGIESDCSVYPPAFTPGKRYLALLGIRPDVKQYEELGENDRWLSFVLSQLRQ